MDTTGRDIGGMGETVRAVSLPVLAGLLVRAVPVLRADFPLNDGGLFYTMVRDLQGANFLIPATTSYNGLDIPFAYPPLGFYVAGGLSSVFGVGLLDVFRFLPLIVATLAIPALYLLAREILSSRFQALLATWAFALLPRAFSWQIVGGGLTRTFGMLFAILTIREAVRLYRTGKPVHVAGMGTFAALTVLSHPQAAEFMAISALLALLAFGRTRVAFRNSVLAAGFAMVLASPWWVPVVAVHGLAPFVSGGQTGINLVNGIFYLLTFSFTDEPYLALLAALGLLGLLNELAVRRFYLPAWLATLFLLDPRNAATTSMVPLAMLSAVALQEVVFARLSGLRDGIAGDALWPSGIIRDRFGRLVLVVVLSVGVIGALQAPTEPGTPLHVVPVENRTAMGWIAANAPASARFAVVTGRPWYVDSTAEWFPTLAGRPSLGTLQGYEWLGKDRWTNQEDLNSELAGCANQGVECLTKWAIADNSIDAWVYLPRLTAGGQPSTSDCCAGLRASLTASPAYEVVYSGPGGSVFRPR